MPSGALTIHFPNGETEYGLTAREIQVGDVLKRNEQGWVVAEVGPEADGATSVKARSATESA
jgi:hypothetical protein